jgi:hypothetical protein
MVASREGRTSRALDFIERRTSGMPSRPKKGTIGLGWREEIDPQHPCSEDEENSPREAHIRHQPPPQVSCLCHSTRHRHVISLLVAQPEDLLHPAIHHSTAPDATANLGNTETRECRNSNLTAASWRGSLPVTTASHAPGAIRLGRTGREMHLVPPARMTPPAHTHPACSP